MWSWLVSSGAEITWVTQPLYSGSSYCVCTSVCVEGGGGGV